MNDFIDKLRREVEEDHERFRADKRWQWITFVSRSILVVACLLVIIALCLLATVILRHFNPW